MNKKVLTLCVSALLASTVMASAAPVDYAPVKFSTGTQVGEAVTKLPEGNDGSLYQLQVTGYTANDQKTSWTNKVLALDEKGTLKVIELTGDVDAITGKANEASWVSSLWCVNVTRPEQNGQNPIFDFTNSQRGMMLSVSAEGYKDWSKSENITSNGATIAVHYDEGTEAISDGEVSGWKFYPVYDGMTGEWFLGSYVDGAVMAVLAWDTNTNGGAVVVKVVENATYADQVSGLLKFTLNKAVDKILTAEQFNTILGTQEETEDGIQLTFVEDANHPDFPNLFSQTKIKAEQVMNGGTATDFVNFYKVADYKDDELANRYYLHVDTAYTNANASSKFLQFAFMDKAGEKFGEKDAPADMTTLLPELGQFIIYYNATEKRIYLRAKTVYNKPDETTTNGIKYWSDLGDNSDYYTQITDAVASTGNDYALKNWIDIQDLTTPDELRIITIKTDETSGIHTKVDFGFGSCNVNPTDRTSKDNGLYIITNEEGKVLAAPISKNGADANVAEWVELDTQDPQHMPAYQWVVDKTQKSEILLPTSPIKVVNREFPALAETIQLRTNEEGAVITTTDNTSGTIDDLLRNAKALTFTQITDSAILSDPYLGYKHLKSSDLMVTKYQFNYLNQFSTDYWIAESEAANDSVLYVRTDAALFGLQEGSTANYGVNPKDYNVEDMVQLVRTNYVIYNTNGKLVETKDNRYAIGAGNYNTKAVVDTFFLKENNHYEGEHFYALIASVWDKNTKTATISNKNANKMSDKVGISDAGMTPELSVEKLNETRTSSFAVKEAESPLYRRFNNVELEGNEGDASDTLRFVEQYRGEVLQIEGNTNFKVSGIDFLGIDDADKAPSGLSFIVDTAWVTRGLGYIKPQYLISIERDDVAATPGVPCDATNHQHMDANGNPTDAAHCFHATPATPAFEFGKYLVNFQDSVNMANDEAAKYAWKEYTRAGFVKAIHYGDSLYILKDQFADVTKADINEALLKEIVDANKVALAKGLNGYIVNLTGDNHKYVTWSMRYIKPGDASDKTFLMESMKDVENNHPGVNGEYDNTSAGDIAPEYAAWLKMQNGCLVLSDSKTSQFEEVTGGDDALIFDVEYVANDEIATENESIVANEVSVVATDGAVIVKGAEGKNVVVSTILGKVVANEVLNSDNETIAAPAGIVVVSVDGESFKVAVK